MSLFTSAKIEIEFTAGSWTDVSAYQTTEWNPIVVKGGRPTEFDPVSAGSVTLDLTNTDGRFTPDNASGAYSPNMVEGNRLRVSLVKGGVTYVIFTGYMQAILPQFMQNDVVNAISSITALDSLSMLSQRTMLGQAGENALSLATANSTWCDYFPLTQQSSTSPLAVVTNSQAATISSGVVQPSSRAVSVGYGTEFGPLVWSNADTQLASDGMIAFGPKPIYGSPYTDAVFGQFLVITPRSGWKAIECMVNLDRGQSGTTNGTDTVWWPELITLNTGSLATKANNVRRVLLEGDSSSYAIDIAAADYSTGFATLGAQSPGRWQKLCFVASGSNIAVYLNDTLATTTSVATTSITQIAIGFDNDYDGDTVPSAGLKWQINAVSAHVSAIAVYGASIRTTLDNSLSSGALTISTGITQITSQLAGYSFSFLTVGSDSARGAVNGYTSGLTGLAALQQLLAGNGGIVWARTDGTVLLMHPDALYPQTSLATFGTESESSDRVDVVTFKRAAESRPTRVTVTSSVTSATATDTVTEAAQKSRRDLSFTTTNATYADALAVAWAGMAYQNALRIDQVSIDLVSASTDLTATLLSTSGTTGALYPTQRVTVQVPSAVLGVSSKDVFIQGWTFSIGQDYAHLQLSCSPANVSTVTGGTCVGSTSTGTVIITSDRPWTTVAQAYPMDLDWVGERIRVNAPGGATSPQTFTCTARGVTGGSAASSKSSGTSIGCWLGSSTS